MMLKICVVLLACALTVVDVHKVVWGKCKKPEPAQDFSVDDVSYQTYKKVLQLRGRKINRFENSGKNVVNFWSNKRQL